MTDSNTVIVGYFVPHCQQKINKETATLNNTLDWMDLIDIYRTSHPNATEYTFFSSAHESLSKIDHMVGHKITWNRLEKTEIISNIFLDHNGLNLEISTSIKKIKTIQIHGG